MKTKIYTREDFVRWGKKGGAINKKRGKKYFEKISAKAAKARKKKAKERKKLSTVLQFYRSQWLST